VGMQMNIPAMEKKYGDFKKIKNKIPYDLAIRLLGTYLKEINSAYKKITVYPCFL
jgi:hypothetical protein